MNARLADAIATVLSEADGVSVESDAVLFVRSLEGGEYCAGYLCAETGEIE